MTDDREDFGELQRLPGMPEEPKDYGLEPELSGESKTWGLGAHLAAFSSLVVPLGVILGPLLVWLVKRKEDPYVERHAREALNFGITFLLFELAVILVALLLGILVVDWLGFVVGGLGLLAALITWLVLVIMGAVVASRGEEYDYAISIRFVKARA